MHKKMFVENRRNHFPSDWLSNLLKKLEFSNRPVSPSIPNSLSKHVTMEIIVLKSKILP